MTPFSCALARALRYSAHGSRLAPWTAILASAVYGVPAAHAQSSNFYAYLTLANDYRYRGLSVVESGVSWQIGADYEHASGFFVGALVANVDFELERPYSEPREEAVDLYAGYSFGRGKWDFSAALSVYDYLNVDTDYGYEELRFNARFMNRVFYTAGYTDSFYSTTYSALHHELGMAQPLPRDFELSAAVGEVDTDLVAAYGGYTYWNVGVSKVLKRVGLDLRFHESSLDAVSYIGDPDGDQWVLSISYGFAPRD